MASISSTPFVDRVLGEIREEFDSNNAVAVAREARCYRIITVAAIALSVVGAVAAGTLHGFTIAWVAAPALALVVTAISYKAFQCVTIVYERALRDAELKGNHDWLAEVKKEVMSFPFFDSVAECYLKFRLT